MAVGTVPGERVRITQLVDLEWGNTPVQIEKIMQNPAPAKPFAGLTILCASPDFVGKKVSMRPSRILWLLSYFDAG